MPVFYKESRFKSTFVQFLEIKVDMFCRMNNSAMRIPAYLVKTEIKKDNLNFTRILV